MDSYQLQQQQVLLQIIADRNLEIQQLRQELERVKRNQEKVAENGMAGE